MNIQVIRRATLTDRQTCCRNALSAATAAAALVLATTVTSQASIVSKTTTTLDAVELDVAAYPSTLDVLADQTSTYRLHDDVVGDDFATGTVRSTVYREADGTLSFLYQVTHVAHTDPTLEYEGFYLEGFSELAQIDAYEATPTGEPVGFPVYAFYEVPRSAYRFGYKYDGDTYDLLIKTDATEFDASGIFTVTGDADGRNPAAFDEDAVSVYAPAGDGTPPPAVPLPPAALPGAIMLAGVAGGSLLRRWRNRHA